LDASFTSFFNKQGSYPRFKSRRDFKQSFQIPDKRVLEIDFKTWQVKVPKLKWIKFHKDRKFEGEIHQATISRTATGRYYISILIETGEPVPQKKKYTENNSVGIDVGVKDFAILSDGTKIPNPKHLEHQLKRLRVEQRSYKRKTGEKNKEKQRLIVAKLHEKIANQRQDFLHKTSTAIAKQYVGVCMEDLNIQGMLKNRKLSRAIQQCGWGMFKAFQKYKLDWRGGTLIEIGRFEPSSKTCSCCGYIKHDLSLADRTWICSNCKSKHDRDTNAAINIKLFGLRTQPFSANAPIGEHC
jgi:putative transposase